jgi:uncharacterized metal-binding protein
LKCAFCKSKECYDGKDCTKIAGEIEKMYTVDDKKSTKVSTWLEAEYYMKKTRLEELIIYSEKMGYHKLGIAFCIGFSNEADLIHRILNQKFEVHSVCCKVGGIDKRKLGLDKLHPEKEFEAMCNPVGQAHILNKERTELNIILGLCIGHDILFTKYSKAPVTTLAVKDRVLAHNPLGAIYSNYYLENVFKIEKEKSKSKSNSK